MLRWIAMLLAVVTFAAACGDDGGTEAGSGSDDSGSDDSGSDDSGSDDNGSDDSGSDDSGSDEPSGVTTLDCAEIQAALEAAGDFTNIDPTGGSAADNAQASFEQSRASLVALGQSAPEIAGEVEQAIEGLDVIGGLLAELNWNTDFSANPAAAMELAGAMGDADVIGMIGAMSAISAWIATSCTS